MILHPHPEFGGTMNNQIAYRLFYMFKERGFAVPIESAMAAAGLPPH